MSQTAVEAKSPRFIGRQLALGFGSVSVVAILMCAMLIAVIHEVSGLVDSMRHDESSIRQGMELSNAVREMSLHIAHTVIEQDRSRLRDYEKWRDQVRSRIQTLAARVPEQERYRLEVLGSLTQRMHASMTASALPAALRGDLRAARDAHREIEELGREAAAHADVLASVTTLQMAHAHDHATSSTRLGLLGGGLCALLIVALSVGFTLRLRAVVIKPLHALTTAALRYAGGDFAFRPGPVGKGELAAVGEAFSHMAEELGRRETKLLNNERMAAIGQLAAGIAHEINNPIGIIRGYLKTMRPDEDAETLREELAILDEEAGHCQRLADDLLAYARTEQLSVDRLNMPAFLGETIKRYDMSGANADLVLEAEDATLEADGARLRQVVLNLLNNAAQVSPQGAAIHILGRQEGEEYVFEVRDAGPGVSDTDKQRIFEPFYSTRRGGTGLGLAVCQGIVRAHNGSISVQDAAGGGSVFRVTLPLKHRNNGAPERPERGSQA